MPEKYFGTLEDFAEGLKLYDKESNGMMSLAELSQVLVAMGTLYIYLVHSNCVLVLLSPLT